MSAQDTPLGFCAECGAPISLYFYPRGGAGNPPGSTLVCTDDGCEHSVAGAKRAQDAAMKYWQTLEGNVGITPEHRR